MSDLFFKLSARDPLVSRDGRPFGLNQGQRMRGLPWLLPSVVAGSFRTVLVKANSQLDFSGDTPQQLLALSVAGVLPIADDELFLPAPADAVAEPNTQGNGIKDVHHLRPQDVENAGCDFPNGASLRPVMLSRDQTESDFKPAALPAWWPMSQYSKWIAGESIVVDRQFLNHPNQMTRDHVCIEAATGAAEESKLFATAGLELTSLPRYRLKTEDDSSAVDFASIQLAVRVRGEHSGFSQLDRMSLWHPLGGERRMVHWQASDVDSIWSCPKPIRKSLADAVNVRMTLATPAIFGNGWKPAWLNDQLEGNPPNSDTRLKLVGVCNGRWKAISGWSLQKINHRGRLDPAGVPGPKPIRRMVPAGGVYFFKVIGGGNPSSLSDLWLDPISDADQERRDGFGLATWGTW